MRLIVSHSAFVKEELSKTGMEYERKKQTNIKAIVLEFPAMIQTLEGNMKAKKGDYLVLGTANEIYPVKKEIFEKIYESIYNVGLKK